MSATVRRWIITHVNDPAGPKPKPESFSIGPGIRRMTLDRQGRNTHATRDEAQASLEDLSKPYGLPRVLTPAEVASLGVREVECWAGHFDPCSAFVDSEDP